MFTGDGEKYRNKVIKDYINVSVVVEMCIRDSLCTVGRIRHIPAVFAKGSDNVTLVL